MLILLLLTSAVTLAEENKKTLSVLPVKQISIFKDGHTFLLHQGRAETNQNGNITNGQG